MLSLEMLFLCPHPPHFHVYLLSSKPDWLFRYALQRSQTNRRRGSVRSHSVLLDHRFAVAAPQLIRGVWLQLVFAAVRALVTLRHCSLASAGCSAFDEAAR